VVDNIKQVNADILSIVADGPKGNYSPSRLIWNNYNLKDPLETQLKTFAKKEKKILMYSGCKMAPHEDIYLSTSYIFHPELPELKAEPHFLTDGEILQLICNIDQTRKYNFTDKPKMNLIPIHNIEVSSCLPEVQQAKAGQKKRISITEPYAGPIPDNMSGVYDKMRLWYTFHFLNQGEPFIVPFPFTVFTE
jgi:hypothetical protein